jgi:hypothetical protein
MYICVGSASARVCYIFVWIPLAVRQPGCPLQYARAHEFSCLTTVHDQVQALIVAMVGRLGWENSRMGQITCRGAGTT